MNFPTSGMVKRFDTKEFGMYITTQDLADVHTKEALDALLTSKEFAGKPLCSNARMLMVKRGVPI